jgi:hypothetical protein
VITTSGRPARRWNQVLAPTSDADGREDGGGLMQLKSMADPAVRTRCSSSTLSSPDLLYRFDFIRCRGRNSIVGVAAAFPEHRAAGRACLRKFGARRSFRHTAGSALPNGTGLGATVASNKNLSLL